MYYSSSHIVQITDFIGISPWKTARKKYENFHKNFELSLSELKHKKLFVDVQ